MDGSEPGGDGDPRSERDDGKREDVAEALALGTGRGDAPARDAAALRYLRTQSQMLDLQMEHLREQRRVQVDHLKLRSVAERLKITFQLLTLAVGLGVAGGVAVAAWQASRERSLVIQPFSTPADFAGRGLGGAVIATHMLDQLSALGAATDSARAPDTYLNSWSKDIKVQIPQTGVSLGEVLQVLRDWLGHETRITGEVVRTPIGLAVTARTGDAAGETVEGPESDLPLLLKRSAESVYKLSQPYRYSVYLFYNGRRDEATAVLRRLATEGAASERPWALTGLGAALAASGRRLEGGELVRKALALDPGLAAGWNVLADLEDALGHDGPAHTARLKLLEALGRRDAGGLTPRAQRQQRLNALARLREDVGDYAGAEPFLAEVAEADDYQAARSTVRARIALDRTLAHQLADADAAVAALPADEYDRPFYAARLAVARAEATDGWAAAAPVLAGLAREAAAGPQRDYRAQIARARLAPWLGYALQRARQGAEAGAVLAGTPADSVPAMRARGLAAAARGEAAEARRWLERAAAAAPASPFASADLGAARLAAGDPAGAVDAYREAVRRGPRWPDGWRGLGRAQARLGQAADARASFARARRLAPAWRGLEGS